MHDSLRQASILFRSRFSTWIPVVIAALLSFGLQRLEAMLAYRILLALLPYRSVLDHTPDFRQLPHVASKVLLCTAPLGLTVVFLIAFFYAVALLVVSALVREHSDAPRPGIAELVSRDARRIALLCVKATVLFFLPGLFVTLLLISTKPFPHNADLANSFVVVLHLVVAFVVGRWALALLRSERARAATPAVRTQAGLAAVLAMIVSIMLSSLLATIEKPWLVNHPAAAAVFSVMVANTLLQCVPVIFLFLWLSCLAAQDDYFA